MGTPRDYENTQGTRNTRLRIWRLGFESKLGPTPASTGWDNGCDQLGNVHWAARAEQD
jgi:hypothetical protein